MSIQQQNSSVSRGAVHFVESASHRRISKGKITYEDLLVKKATQYFFLATEDKKQIKYIKAKIGDRTFTCLRSHKGNPRPLVQLLFPNNLEKQNLHVEKIISILSDFHPKNTIL